MAEHGNWVNVSSPGSRAFTCGYCDNSIASNQGYFRTMQGGNSVNGYIFICHECHQPNYFDSFGKQTPGSAFGRPVQHIPEATVQQLYDEARSCMKVGAHTSAVLACRKLLMHIAVANGAAPGQSFLAYVEHLANSGYVPPNGKTWVDHIRQKGNEANHEIVIMTRQHAEDLIAFSEMLLKFIYEFPARVPKPTG